MNHPNYPLKRVNAFYRKRRPVWQMALFTLLLLSCGATCGKVVPDKVDRLVTLQKEYQAGRDMAMREAACPWADNSCQGCHK